MSRRPWTMRASLSVVLALGIAALGDDCDGDIAQDPTFRDWCGASLCAWHLDAGSIKPAPTWNENDLGVSFVDTPTQISQVTTESQATCILFTSVADIDPTADMTLGVDFNNDGTVEQTWPIGATQWENVETEITAPAVYQGITFILRKAGTGTAILAEMRIQSSSGCTAPPVALSGLSLGEKCSTSAACAEGLTCTGVNGYDLCSQCSASVSCGDGGVTCTARSVFLPSQCGPGEALGAPKAPCLAGSDCQSGLCQGAQAIPVNLADEGGACDLDAALGDADPTNCSWYGARGGQCL
jgi:hypothetical protein